MTQPLVLAEDEAYELLAYLIASADVGVSEPAFYGPRRLLDAAARLAAAMASRVDPEDRAWLVAFAGDAQEKQNWARRNPEGFRSFLEESARGVATELKRRSGLPTAGDGAAAATGGDE